MRYWGTLKWFVHKNKSIFTPFDELGENMKYAAQDINVLRNLLDAGSLKTRETFLVSACTKFLKIFDPIKSNRVNT